LFVRAMSLQSPSVRPMGLHRTSRSRVGPAPAKPRPAVLLEDQRAILFSGAKRTRATPATAEAPRNTDREALGDQNDRMVDELVLKVSLLTDTARGIGGQIKRSALLLDDMSLDFSGAQAVMEKTSVRVRQMRKSGGCCGPWLPIGLFVVLILVFMRGLSWTSAKPLVVNANAAEPMAELPSSAFELPKQEFPKQEVPVLAASLEPRIVERVAAPAANVRAGKLSRVITNLKRLAFWRAAVQETPTPPQPATVELAESSAEKVVTASYDIGARAIVGADLVPNSAAEGASMWTNAADDVKMPLSVSVGKFDEVVVTDQKQVGLAASFLHPAMMSMSSETASLQSALQILKWSLPPSLLDSIVLDHIGSYHLVAETILREGPSQKSRKLQSLANGTVVEVLEVFRMEDEDRLRGRVKEPAGWISIKSLDSQWRWANPIHVSLNSDSDVETASAKEQQQQQQLAAAGLAEGRSSEHQVAFTKSLESTSQKPRATVEEPQSEFLGKEFSGVLPAQAQPRAEQPLERRLEQTQGNLPPKEVQSEVSTEEETSRIYRLMGDAVLRDGPLLSSKNLQTVPGGDLLEVVEVVQVRSENRLRGRVRDPVGWISLESLDSRWQWAALVHGEDLPGMYHLIGDSVLRDASSVTSKKLGVLKSGSDVEVMQVIQVDAVNRLRARVKQPAGWISLKSLDSKWRWATPIGHRQERMAGSADAGREDTPAERRLQDMTSQLDAQPTDAPEFGPYLEPLQVLDQESVVGQRALMNSKPRHWFRL